MKYKNCISIINLFIRQKKFRYNLIQWVNKKLKKKRRKNLKIKDIIDDLIIKILIILQNKDLNKTENAKIICKTLCVKLRSKDFEILD